MGHNAQKKFKTIINDIFLFIYNKNENIIKNV